MRITDQYIFEDYYLVVISNISKKLLTKKLLDKTKDELGEIIYNMYYSDISPEKATVLMESFYSVFKKFLND